VVPAKDRPVLRSGSIGTWVAEWQRGIGLQPTGDFDAITVSATRKWQAQRGLTVDGVVGTRESWPTLMREQAEDAKADTDPAPPPECPS
jgi:peptidoglycan hydrolase-like protein with peptidoglycan-binding domain